MPESIMKAAVFHGPRDVRFEEIDTPVLEPGDLLLRIKACGICGSDLHTYRHGLFQQLGNPVADGRVLGHEFCGEIVEIGGGHAPGMHLGDRVVAVGSGGNAEFVRIPAAMTGNMMSVLDATGDAEAATMEPLATSLHAANLGQARDGETHLVMGAGIIGLGILQCIKARTNASDCRRPL